MTKPFILIIESDPWDRDMLLMVLQGHADKFRWIVAASTGAAQLILNKTNVDLIILSSAPLGVPGMQFLSEIRNAVATKNIPVIFLSGREDLDEEYQATKAGADVYQSRAFNAGVLIAQIERQLERKRFPWAILDVLAVKVELSPVQAVAALAAVIFVVRIIDRLIP